jgi:hypothetical protein
MKTLFASKASLIIGVALSAALSFAGVVTFSAAASATVPATDSHFCVALETGNSAIDAVGMPVTGSLYERAVATVSEDRANLTGLHAAAKVAPSASLAGSLNDLSADFTYIVSNLTQEIALHPATVVQQAALNKESAALAKIKDNTSPAYGKEYKAFQATLTKLNALNARAIVFDNKAVVEDKALVQLQVSLVATPVFFTCRNDKQVVQIAKGIALYADRLASANSRQGHIARAVSYMSQASRIVTNDNDAAKVTPVGSRWQISNSVAEACLAMSRVPGAKYTVTYGACTA